MRRRKFIGLLGSLVASGSPIARAQQPAPGKWRIGLLAQKSRQDPFRQGLRGLGYIEGDNIALDIRTNERIDQLDAIAGELVDLRPDVMIAAGTQAVQAVQRATKSIPIVMVASDPVENHLVPSLAHPDGNTTGLSLMSPDLSGKRIEILRDVTRELSSLAVLWNPDDPPAAIAFKQTQEAASAMHLQLLAVEARSADDLDSAFDAIAKARPQGLDILNAPFLNTESPRIADFALSLKLPSIYTDKSFARAGGLISYGPDFDDTFIRAAGYVDRILKGAKPADLPVEQPTKFDLFINLKTAKALGLEVPAAVLALANEVIE
jgi:putative ABC transport system substrate-binding protein